MNRRRRSIACISGGMDSAVSATAAARESEDLFGLHANYGQRTEARELDCFHRLCERLGARGRMVADLSFLGAIGGSSLTDPALPVQQADLGRVGIPSSYVPFRNAHLLACAVSWAEVIGAEAVYFGAVAEDSSGYPDCQPRFYELFQELADAGTRPETKIEIVTPVIQLSKRAIVLLGRELGTPFELTWSCYQSGDVACGECDSCALRLRGFQQAGVTDPLPYKKVFRSAE
jgi:7-cyano-7-deazaguanine synthase